MTLISYQLNALESKTVKELLVIATSLKITGRHDMRKNILIEAIVKASESNDAQEVSEEFGFVENAVEVWDSNTVGQQTETSGESKPKVDYIESAKIGTIIAFKINDRKTLSGMIEEIHKHEFVVATKSGIRFNVRKKNVVWVKTGARWPKGVYLALKGESEHECKGINQAQ